MRGEREEGRGMIAGAGGVGGGGGVDRFGLVANQEVFVAQAPDSSVA